jgi:hypothetical protein
MAAPSGAAKPRINLNVQVKIAKNLIKKKFIQLFLNNERCRTGELY